MPGVYGHEPYPGGCQLMASPYHEPYAAEPAYAPEFDAMACGVGSVPYYAHMRDTTSAYSDNIAPAFLDSPYSLGFYPSLIPSAGELMSSRAEFHSEVDLRAVATASFVPPPAHHVAALQHGAASPLHDYSSCMLEPSGAKRFKPTPGVEESGRLVTPQRLDTADIYAKHVAMNGLDLDSARYHQQDKLDSCSVAMAMGGELGASELVAGRVVVDDEMAEGDVAGYSYGLLPCRT